MPERPLPPQLIPVDGIVNAANTVIDTGVYDDVDDMVYEIRVKPSAGNWYILRCKNPGTSQIYGISGASSGSTITYVFPGASSPAMKSDQSRNTSHVYTVRGIHKNGEGSLYVWDETADTEDTQTKTYTTTDFVAATVPLCLFGNGTDNVAAGNTVYSVKLWKSGELVFDGVPAADIFGNTGLYDLITGYLFRPSAGSVTSGGLFPYDGFEPATRKEAYLYAIAECNVDLCPDPATRKEMLLTGIAYAFNELANS